MSGLLDGSTDVLSDDLGGARLGVEISKTVDVDLRALGDLSLADAGVLKGVDGNGLLLDGLSDDLRAELLEEHLEIAASSLALDDLTHLTTESADLGRLSIGSLLVLTRAALGEGKGEETDDDSIGGLDLNDGLDEGLPLTDERLGVVRGQGHTVEVGEALIAIDVVGDKLDGAVTLILRILVQISERDGEDAAHQSIRGELLTSSLVHTGATNETGSRSAGSSSKERGGTDGVPLLLGEGISSLLGLGGLSRTTLVLSNGHFGAGCSAQVTICCIPIHHMPPLKPIRTIAHPPGEKSFHIFFSFPRFRIFTPSAHPIPIHSHFNNHLHVIDQQQSQDR